MVKAKQKIIRTVTSKDEQRQSALIAAIGVCPYGCILHAYMRLCRFSSFDFHREQLYHRMTSNFVHTEHITGPGIVYMQSRSTKLLAGTLLFPTMHYCNCRVVPSHPHAR